MRKALLLAAAVVAIAVLPMAPANAGQCTSTGLNAQTGETVDCDISLSVSVPTAVSITFSSADGAFGTVIAGTTSTDHNIDYSISGNQGGTNTTVLKAYATTGANNNLFEFKKHGGGFVGLNTITGVANATTVESFSGATGNGGYSDMIHAKIPSGNAAGNFTATLTYQLTVS